MKGEDRAEHIKTCVEMGKHIERSSAKNGCDRLSVSTDCWNFRRGKCTLQTSDFIRSYQEEGGGRREKGEEKRGERGKEG